MKYIRINNFLDKFNQPNYKGLDINEFIAGSQVYLPEATYCIVATNQELTTLPTDVVEITLEQYNTEKTAIATKVKQESQSITDRISSVEVAIANLMGV